MRPRIKVRKIDEKCGEGCKDISRAFTELNEVELCS
jgi:hypothetical protein